MLDGVTFRDDWVIDWNGRRWSRPEGSTCAVTITADADAGQAEGEMVARAHLTVRSTDPDRCCRLRVTVNGGTYADRILFPANSHEVAIPFGPESKSEVIFGFCATRVEDPVFDLISQSGPGAGHANGLPAAVALDDLVIERSASRDRYKLALIAAGRAASENLFPAPLHEDAWSNSEALVTLIRTAAAERRPFSMVRLGDGEGRVLAYPHLLSERETELETINYMFGAAAIETLRSRYGDHGLSGRYRRSAATDPGSGRRG